MTHRDADHQIAEIIKGLEERIADLEGKDRAETTPILLRTIIDRIDVNDSVGTIREQQLQTAKWNNEEAGWQTSTWGRSE